MSAIFNEIKRNYGRSALQEARRLVSYNITIEKEYSHLWFNHTCKSIRILPKSLRFSPPIRTRKGFQLARKSGWQFLNLRISDSHQKINDCKLQVNSIKEKLGKIMTLSEMNALNQYATVKSKSVQEKTKLSHSKKLQRLIPEYRPNNNKNIDKSWVKNLSSRQFSKSETEVLSKGMKFAVAPRKVPVLDFVCGVEQGLKEVADKYKSSVDLVRSRVTQVLSNAKPPQSNLTKDETESLKKLQGYDDIIVLSADKGNCTVVMDKSDYESKLMVLLNDSATYKIVTKNPNSAIEKRLNNFIRRLCEGKKICSDLFKLLRSCDSVLPRIYGLPKIHKPNVPLRPIVSFVGSATYNLSKFLKNVLSPLVGTTKYSVKNSKEFVDLLSSIKIKDFESQVSFDVVRLFTSVHIDLARSVVLKQLSSDCTLVDRTGLCVNDIMKAF